MNTGSVLVLRTLGVPRASVVGAPLDVTGKSLALLMFLAVEGETPREVLADLLWSDQEGDAARRNLRVQLHRLKGAGLSDWLEVGPGAVALRGEVQVDLLALRAALASGDVAGAAAFARGRFLDHLSVPGAAQFEEWQERVAGQALEEQLRALDALAAFEAGRGGWAAALSAHAQALTLDPLRERSVRAQMEVLAAMGRREDALDAYRSLCRRLRDELGAEPLPATRVLAEGLERDRPAAPPAAALVGRAAEVLALRAARTMLVLGEAGIGKSRLLREAAGDALVLRGAPELTPLPFGALLDAFRSDTSGLAWCPEFLRPGLAAALSAPGGVASTDRGAMLDVLAQALLALAGGRAVVVEDLHWLDAGSLEAAFLALHRGARHVWLSARPGELQERAEVLAVLGRVNPARLTLTELPREAVNELIAGLAGGEAPLFTARLFEATAGHPLFLMETLRDLRERGLLAERGGRWHTPFDAFTVDYAEVPVPPSVTQAIRGRVERLGRVTRQLLQAGALWGESFPVSLVAGCVGVPVGEALDELERAQEARLVTPDGAGFRFGHDLHRRALLEDLGTARRGHLHGQLAALAPDGTPAGTVAQHFEAGGQPERAWPLWVRAAREAEGLFAHADAFALYGRALACGAPPRQAFAVRVARSELCRHLDDEPGREAELDALAALAAGLDDAGCWADLAARRAKWHTERDEYALAVAEVRAALGRFGGALDDDVRSALLLEGGAAMACLEDWPASAEWLQEALTLTRERLPVRASNVLYWLGYGAYRSGEYAQAAVAYRQSVDVLPAGTLSRGRVLSLWKVGACLRRMGQWCEASAALREADDSARTLNAGSIRGLIVAEQAALAFDQGEREVASALAAEARTLLSPGGTEGWDVLNPLLAALASGAVPATR
ncbi:BTAD domain-containing putative transcriptional regulator [Deinococcus sp. JMULE3]|uniref:ATP-binding protein n=1 Tax=Deinococcus sp. JMULE3 TaxID=2518341 RepID=UPI0015762311|nr:BTAD domain-containing putative transcriptional regulator [Deinococcus sp. JMULE3]